MHTNTPAGAGPVDQLVRPAAKARWYAVAKDGRATLCAGERDARESAASFDAMWPHSAPHRAVLLGDVRAERERCAAILDANAQCCDGMTAEILSSNAAAIRDWA